jgi:iron complex outermembrane receptor protein
VCAVSIGATALLAEDHPDGEGPAVYRTMSIEELMEVEVTSASRRPERLAMAPSAIQVVEGDDIRRSGATDLPEALRLAPNLQVAQVNASQWAISARGFDNVLANKLLVMIDGRTVYTPFYAGVFWDVQHVLLEDVERIEVVSGPGGALWGANAVNGVISVLTKDAEATQGTYATASVGTARKDFAALRSGGRIAPDLYLRVYGQRFDNDSTVDGDGHDAKDDWGLTQGGFRADWKPGADTLTLQGDAYDGEPDPDGGKPVVVRGANTLGRWRRVLSAGADVQVQAYYDWTWRDLRNGFSEDLVTYDFDAQHRFQLGRRNEVVWGLGCRLMEDTVQNLDGFAVTPADERLHLYSGFAQDDITIVMERLHLILGTRIEHNDFTGVEHQPSGRLAWTPTERDAVWAAVSRAVRTPARLDTDFTLSLSPTFPVIVTSRDFDSETVLAYELGWRTQPLETLSVSAASFYNRYDHLRSAEPGPPPFGLPLTFANGVEGETYGLELSGECQVTGAWRLRGGCTFMRKHLRTKPGSNDANDASAESDDPESQYLLQSTLDLPWRMDLDAVARYVAPLPDPHVPGYVGLDLRLASRPTANLEFAVVGQNLIGDRHPEFVPASPAPREIERSVYGSLAARW